ADEGSGAPRLPADGLLSPPLAHWLGPRVVGALAVVAAAALFERIAHDRWGDRAWIGATWFAAGAATTLFSGRMTFALGLVPALASLWALERAGGPAREGSRRGLLALAVALALLTPLASPVAALFLALARAPGAGGGGVRGRGDGRRRARGRAGGRGGGAPARRAAGGRVPGGRDRAVRVLVVLAGAGGRGRRARADPARGARAADRRRPLRAR